MTQLTHAIEEAPRVILKAAKSLGIQQIVRVPPRLYTKKLDDIRTFNLERAERNFEEIDDLCDRSPIIITDIENEHRDRVRRPFEYADVLVSASINQYIACWSWFRSHWPDAKLFEWNLTNSREPGRHDLAEQLVLNNLDGFAVSCFYRRKGNWFDVRQQVVAHAKSLVEGTDKIVLAGIHEMHNDDTLRKKVPVPRHIVDLMVTVALQADVAMLWSITFTDPIDNLAVAHARVLEVLVGMALQEASDG